MGQFQCVTLRCIGHKRCAMLECLITVCVLELIHSCASFYRSVTITISIKLLHKKYNKIVCSIRFFSKSICRLNGFFFAFKSVMPGDCWENNSILNNWLFFSCSGKLMYWRCGGSLDLFDWNLGFGVVFEWLGWNLG